MTTPQLIDLTLGVAVLLIGAALAPLAVLIRRLHQDLLVFLVRLRETNDLAKLVAQELRTLDDHEERIGNLEALDLDTRVKAIERHPAIRTRRDEGP